MRDSWKVQQIVTLEIRLRITRLSAISLTLSSCYCLRTPITFRHLIAIIHTMAFVAKGPAINHKITSQMSRTMDWCQRDFKHRSTPRFKRLLMISWHQWPYKLIMLRRVNDSFMKPGLPNRNTDKETGFSQWSQLILSRLQKHQYISGNDIMSQQACLVWDKQHFHNAVLTFTG